MGHRAIYADGWKAVTRHKAGMPFSDDDWELYWLAGDRSECVNLASAEPDRLAELIALWWTQAQEHGVLPLDDRTIELFGAREQGSGEATRDLAGLAGASRPAAGSRRAVVTAHPASRRYVYRPPMSPMPAQASARIGGRSWDLDATIDRPAGAGGVLYASGNQNSGLSLFIDHDRLLFDYNCFGEHHVAQSGIAVPAGRSVVGVRFRRAGDGRGHATLVIDETECGRVEIPFVMYIISSIGSSVGYDHSSPVSDRYQSPFRFQGVLDRVQIQILPGHAASAETAAQADARAAMSRQ
jgi:hypothetical protein